MKEAARDENPKLAVEQRISTKVEKFGALFPTSQAVL